MPCVVVPCFLVLYVVVLFIVRGQRRLRAKGKLEQPQSGTTVWAATGTDVSGHLFVGTPHEA
jgi:hypothetical protein